MGMPALSMGYVRAPRQLGVAGAFALLLSVLVSLWVAMDYLDARDEQQRLQDRAARAQAGPSSRERGIRPGASSPQAGQALALLDAPWEELFDGMAQAAARLQVAVLRLEADGGKRTLRLTAQARNFAVARQFVEQLQRMAPVTAVALNSHESTADGGQTVLRFQVDLSWGGQP